MKQLMYIVLFSGWSHGIY